MGIIAISAAVATLDDIRAWREMYRAEMGCQIVHDSIHARPGWTREYALAVAGVPVGYGSVAVGGPWKHAPTIYEFYVAPNHRLRLFDLFGALISGSGAARMEAQSNDPIAAAMLHAFAGQVTSESILFEDRQLTAHTPAGATFRQPTPAEAPDVAPDDLPWRGVVEVEGRIAATGGILFHYNPPFGDIYMEVADSFRGRGLGAYIVQELKRVCYEGGHVPAARCRTGNAASRRTLQKAGFVPCGHILIGSLEARP